jgi:hypothetical protein
MMNFVIYKKKLKFKNGRVSPPSTGHALAENKSHHPSTVAWTFDFLRVNFVTWYRNYTFSLFIIKNTHLSPVPLFQYFHPMYIIDVLLVKTNIKYLIYILP